MAFGITGIGLESPLASSLAGLAQALRQGRIAAGQPAQGFDERTGVPARRARRLSRLARMMIAATRSALAEAGLTPDPLRTAVVLGTGLGSLGTTVAFLRSTRSGQAEAEPTGFVTSVVNEPASQVSIELGLRGPNLTVMHHQASVLGALALGVDLLRLSRADAVVCGGCDELGPEIEHALARLRLRSRAGCARPLDRRRDGIVPGEAAVALVLERTEDAARRGAGAVRALVGGVGLFGEPVAAVRAALEEAGLSASEIGYVALSSNGSPGLDRAEAALLAQLFGPRPVPAGSILGATGELAASAGLRLLQAVAALEGLGAGTPGFEEPDPDAPVPGLLRRATTLAPPPRAVLVPALPAAPDGAAAAAVLTRPES